MPENGAKGDSMNAPYGSRILPPTGSLPDFCKQPEEFCSRSSDGTHCDHWWDGEECHFCGAAEMPMEQKVEQGMVEGPVRNSDAR